jgi:hypothetical protein
MYQAQEEPAHLLMTKDEMNWMTTAREPDRSVDVFLLLGCGARGLPHILRDSVGRARGAGRELRRGRGSAVLLRQSVSAGPSRSRPIACPPHRSTA